MPEKKNDFSKGSVSKWILKMAIPLSIAQFINILYNLVDRMYIGRLPETGRLALTGVGICLPVILIITAFSNLCGMGGAPLCSMARGRGDEHYAERVMGNAFVMLIFISVILMGVGYGFMDNILFAFGASKDTIIYAKDYLSIYMIGTVPMMITLGMNPFINSQGFGRVGMMTTVLGAVINIILDPIFIFALGMGVNGAALATAIAQTCSAIWVLIFLCGRKAILRLKASCMKPVFSLFRRILSLGVSGFFLTFTTSLVSIVCNTTLLRVGGDLYVSVMTVASSFHEIAFATTSGISNGANPVIGYNYGAKCYGRICEAIRFSTIAAMAIAFIFWIVTEFCPGFCIRIFNSDPDLLKAGIPAFRLYYCAYFMFPLQMIGQTVSLSLGKSKTAIFFSLLRKVILVIPLSLILPGLWNLGPMGVFLAEPVSIVVGCSICYITMMLTVYKPMKKLDAEQKALLADKNTDTEEKQLLS